MPVGTKATVKAVLPRDLAELGARIVLANTYHLYFRPGRPRWPRTAGCTASWPGTGRSSPTRAASRCSASPDTRVVREDGVEFSSVYDGSRHVFTPELAMAVQEDLGRRHRHVLRRVRAGHGDAGRGRRRRRAHDALGGGLQGGADAARPAPHRHRPGRRRRGPAAPVGRRAPLASASTPTPSAASPSASAAPRCWPRSSSWTSCCRPTACATSWGSAIPSASST